MRRRRAVRLGKDDPDAAKTFDAVVVRGEAPALPADALGPCFRAATGEYVDMFKAGIIDPAKVTRSALQNAASIAGLFLTTEAVIAEKPEKEKAPAAPGGGDMDF